MNIKRQYEMIGVLLQRDPKAKEFLEAACEDLDDDMQKFVLNHENEIILHDADLGCGIPGDRYVELMKKLDVLDMMDPYDNGLNYQDVSEVEFSASRRGNAVRLVMWCNHVEQPRRIVKVIAVDDEKVIEDWGVRRPEV